MGATLGLNKHPMPLSKTPGAPDDKTWLPSGRAVVELCCESNQTYGGLLHPWKEASLGELV
jgi:hypothetical protein